MDFKYDKAIGKRIRDLREKKGLTQEELAFRMQVNGCDITRSALAKIEVGQRHIYSDEIKCFAKVLGVSYPEIFV